VIYWAAVLISCGCVFRCIHMYLCSCMFMQSIMLVKVVCCSMFAKEIYVGSENNS
jgi:hypothetical protein